jgi:hypothetical protein
MNTNPFILCFSVLSLFFQSCGQKQNNINETRIAQVKKCFPIEFTSHFPVLNSGDVLNLEIVFPAACYAENWSGIHMVMKLPDEDIKKYEIFCKDSCLAVYHFTDQCLSMINYNKSDYKDSPIKLTICDTINNDRFPVPNFGFLFKSLPDSSFFNDALIYVLKAEKGSFLKGDDLSKKGVGLSVKWTHGFSKGIVLNHSQKKAFFWLEVW